MKPERSLQIGADIYQLAADLFPINRSLTGQGVRDSLDLLKAHVPLDVHAVPSGTEVLDWTVPKEWNIRDAWLKDPSGKTVISLSDHSLHVMGYSTPVHAVMPLDALEKHLHSLPDQPELIPYRTGYYADTWGFCLSQTMRDSLPDGDYEVMIDATLSDGVLNYGEFFHQGESDEEVVMTTHCCHPSLANDNCSGMAMLAHVAHQVSQIKTKFSYRFLWLPGTIGAITWLALNEERIRNIGHGLVVTGLGDASAPTYKRSRSGRSYVDRAMWRLLSQRYDDAKLLEFTPYGYDERQFNSPGYNLNFGLLQRSEYATFPQYHTSADNLDFISPEHLADSFELIYELIDMLESDCRPINTVAKGEPQLGKRGLYDAIGGNSDGYDAKLTMLWVLNLADGEHSLLDMAERAGVDFETVLKTADLLAEHGLLSGMPAAKP